MKTTVCGIWLAENIKQAAAVLLAVSILSGCAPEANAPSNSALPVSAKKSAIQSAIEESNFRCASYGIECPENVGMVFSDVGSNPAFPEIGQCTGFLVSDSIVATNSHCIPESLKANPASCENGLVIRFPDGRAKSTYACKKILSFSKLGFLDADYSFFEIEKTDRVPLKISRSGIKQGESLRIFKVNPTTSTAYYPSPRDRGGVLEQSRCTGALGTLLNLKSASPFSETAVAFNCSVRPGNSGSPVVNAQGEVVGIAQAFLLEGYNRLLQANFHQYSQSLPETLPPHVLFTNLACVPDPVSQQFAMNECEAAKGLNLFSCIDRNDPVMEKGFAHTYEPWKQKLPPIFLYTKIQDLKSGSMTATPQCVVPKAAAASTYENYVRKSGLVYGFRTEKIDTMVPLDLEVKGRLQFDSYYRPVLPIVFTGDTTSERRIELEKDGEVWTGNISTRKDLFGIGHWQSEKTISIRDCTELELASGNVELARLETGEIVNEARATEIAIRAKSISPPPSPYCAH